MLFMLQIKMNFVLRFGYCLWNYLEITLETLDPSTFVKKLLCSELYCDFHRHFINFEKCKVAWYL